MNGYMKMIPSEALSSRINEYSFMLGAVLTLTFNNVVIIMSPPTLVGRHIVFVLSVCPSHSLSAQLL